MKIRTKSIFCALLSASLLLTAVACTGNAAVGNSANEISSNQTSESSIALKDDKENMEKTEKMSGTMGQITSIEGNSITLNVMGSGRGGKNGSKGGMTPPDGEIPSGGETPTALPEGETPPESGQPANTDPPNGGRGGKSGSNGDMTLPDGSMPAEGEQQILTITVTDSTVFTNKETGETIALSDLAVGDILQVELAEDKTSALSITFMGNAESFQGKEKPTESVSEVGSAI